MIVVNVACQYGLLKFHFTSKIFLVEYIMFWSNCFLPDSIFARLNSTLQEEGPVGSVRILYSQLMTSQKSSANFMFY